ncbi:hypothetical protein ACCI51_14290 [Microbulbifer echini]|uniref:DUF3311 domain-containing protein n=1 Tax=Microbulbifer echini TaxID=1529067 RepID=A0ABV4NQP6_9GAMM
MRKNFSLSAVVSLAWAISWRAIVINLPIYMPFSALDKLGYEFPNWFWYLLCILGGFFSYVLAFWWVLSRGYGPQNRQKLKIFEQEGGNKQV